MSTFARDTQVGPDRSRAEIERTLERYGADGFMYGWDQERAVVGFKVAGRQVRIALTLPGRDDPAFKRTPRTRQMRSPEAARAAWEQAVRQRWRALALVVKAKLEAVEAGISSFDEEFLAWLVLPGGATVAETALPAIEEAYRTGKLPALIPALIPALPAPREAALEWEAVGDG